MKDDIEKFRKNGHFLIDYIADFYSDLSRKTIVPPSESYLDLIGTGFEKKGKNFDKLFKEMDAKIIEGTILQIHPRFFGFVPSSGLPIGNLADLLISFLNQNAGRATGGPSSSIVEDIVLKWIFSVIDFPDGAGGLLVSGGSVANLHAMIAARNSVNDDIPTMGLNAEN
ncbi:MAG: pyridoxal-dependent decarboxylase, partial [Candidatus Hodarchaeales archaeon]